MSDHPFSVLPFDRWRSATDGLVNEVVRMDSVCFTSLVDVFALDVLRERAAAEGRGKPSYTALVISLALRENPDMNRLVLAGRYRYRPVQLNEVHATVAVERVRDGEDTVYAGIIRDTDRKSALEIHEALQRLAASDEKGDPRLRLFMRLVRWTPGWLCRWLCGLPRFGPALWRNNRGGSFALTTVGKYGVDAICAKWPWPLTFTFGEVKQRPMVVEGRVLARPSFYLSMGFDRRLCNGAPAARFFKRIVDLLENTPAGDGQPAESEQAGCGVAART